MKAIYTNINDNNHKMLEMMSNLKGIKKNHIINEALEYYFNAIKVIPEEFIIKPTYVDSDEFERLERESKPTQALIRLLNDDNWKTK